MALINSIAGMLLSTEKTASISSWDPDSKGAIDISLEVKNESIKAVSSKPRDLVSAQVE
jgi:hypothetical protein